jgi:hypothetical protein
MLVGSLSMMGTTKLGVAASRSRVVAPGSGVGVVALVILIVGVRLLIEGCGPPI